MSAVRTRRSAFEDRLPLLCRTGCRSRRGARSCRCTCARAATGRSLAAAPARLRRPALLASATTATVPTPAAIRTAVVSTAAVPAPAACLRTTTTAAGASGPAGGAATTSAASRVCGPATSCRAASRRARLGTDSDQFRTAHLAGCAGIRRRSAPRRRRHLVFRAPRTRLGFIFGEFGEDRIRRRDYGRRLAPQWSQWRCQPLPEICRSGWCPHVPGG